MSKPPDRAAQLLRDRGLRWTRQRAQVLDAVQNLGHATPDEVFQTVRDTDLATVYRTLDLLEGIGLIRHTHLDHGAPAYRPAGDDHIHVVCHRCGRLVEVAPALVDDLQERLHAQHGFELDRSHLTIFGACADCAAAGPDAAPDASAQAGRMAREHVHPH